MVDAVSTDYIVKGNNIILMRIVGVSDGTGESDVVKLDVSALTGPDGVNPPSKIKIEEIQYDVQGWDAIQLEWDGTTDTPAMVLSGQGVKLWLPGEGVVSDNADGTGDLLLTTVGTATANYTYDITLRLRLKV